MIVEQRMLPFRKILCLSVLMVCVAIPVRSQSIADWTVVYVDVLVDKEEQILERTWPAGLTTPDVPGNRWRNDLQQWLHSRGWFRARILDVDREARVVSVHRGPATLVSGVAVEGWPATFEGLPGGLRETHKAVLVPGDTLTEGALERHMDTLLAAATKAGRLASRVRVARLEPEGDRIHVTFAVEPGPEAVVEGVDFEGDARTKPVHRARIAGITSGQGAAGLDLERARRRTAAAPTVRRAGTPRYVLTSDSTARLVIPVESAPPGQFDLTAGWLPGSAGNRGQFIGGGHLNLLNAFGAGRAIDVELDRRPSQVSQAFIRVSDPMIAGLPFAVDASFSGIQQDSTYANRRWSGAVNYLLDDRLSLGVRLTGDVTRPGQAGLRVVEGRQRIPRAEALLWGVQVELRSVDSEWQPTRGIHFRSLYERGDRTTRARDTAETNAVERMELALRGYLPTTTRTVLALGADLRGVRGDALDESQSIRFGGARSLRGYDEDRFLVRSALRTFVEWRYLLERDQRVFAFVDLGWVEDGAAADAGSSGWYPGFGVGAQVETGAGIMDLSYALNPEESLVNGRIHIGLSFGL
jgi:outer membrane protein assembly factor BamA